MKLRSLRKDENAVLGYFLAFIFAVTMIVFLFAFAIPFATSFSTDLYVAGDSILEDAQDKIDSISNATIRTRIQDSLDNMQDATAENIEHLAFFYQYSWIFVVIIITFTFFMLARKIVETKGYSGVV